MSVEVIVALGVLAWFASAVSVGLVVGRAAARNEETDYSREDSEWQWPRKSL